MPTGIIDQTINLSVTRDRPFDQISNLFSSGDVAINENRVPRTLRPGLFAQCICHLETFSFVVAADHDSRSSFYKLLRTAFADAAAAAGDNDNLVCVTHVSHWKSPRSLFDNRAA